MISAEKSYNEAIEALNGLISNATTLQANLEMRDKLKLVSISRTNEYIERSGLSLTELNKLNVIHVAGTKGKGSTCTYIDSILSKNGFKTGLYTSPHLREVRERIRINGKAVSKSYFSDTFWNVYEKLYYAKKYNDDMPFYFQFLTIMAFNVFVDQKVDYVILETGIGGRYDNTNVITSPKIACITSIGYDHMDILGNSLTQIAWNKAGIIKKHCPVITCDNQNPEVLKVIKEESDELNSPLILLPINSEEEKLRINKIGAVIHKENELLAIATCKYLLDKENSFLSIDSAYQKIIEETVVAGRYKLIQQNHIRYMIDGAHTVESIRTTVEWYKLLQNNKNNNRSLYLIFMITGRRNAYNLLETLNELDFDGLLLAPIIPNIQLDKVDFAPDPSMLKRDQVKITEITSAWKRLLLLTGKLNKPIHNFDCFQSIVNWLNHDDQSKQGIDVIVVGSLHLVGCALEVLEKSLDE